MVYFALACGAVYVENFVLKRKGRIDEVRREVEGRIERRIGAEKIQI
jgi:hypothetical protein